MEDPLMASQLVSRPCVYGGSCSCALLFTSISVVSSLIEISLLRARPAKHGFPVEVNLPILFPHRSTYDHDVSTVIPIQALALACLISY
jgi:hypothetical protein